MLRLGVHGVGVDGVVLAGGEGLPVHTRARARRGGATRGATGVAAAILIEVGLALGWGVERDGRGVLAGNERWRGDHGA